MSEETRGLTGNPAAAASSSSSSNSSGSNSNSGGNDGTNLENYLAEKKHFDRFISRIKFSNNKALMYKLLFLWIIGVVFSIAIMALLLNNDATYHLVNAYRQAFVEEELEFDDVQVPKQLWEIDNEQDFFAVKTHKQILPSHLRIHPYHL